MRGPCDVSAPKELNVCHGRYALAAPDKGMIAQGRCIGVAASDSAFPASLSFPVPSIGVFHPLP